MRENIFGRFFKNYNDWGSIFDDSDDIKNIISKE